VDQQPDDLGSRVGQLETALDEIRLRLHRIERALAIETSASVPAAAGVVEAGGLDLSSNIALTGTSILGLGGAYFLRALTESKVLPQIAGVALGLAYAAMWIWAADRAARGGRRAAAIFRCGTGALIAYPLVWETTTRFGLLRPQTGAVLIAVFGLIVVGVATRDRISWLAWIAAAGSIGTALAVIATTQTIVPLMLSLTVVGATTLYVAYERAWLAVPWPMAAAANLLAIAVLAGAIWERTTYTPATIVASLVAYSLIWLSVIAVRRVAHREDPALLDVAQSVQVVAVGIGGALYVAVTNAIAPTTLAVSSLALAAAGYAVTLGTSEGVTRKLRAWFGATAAFLAALGSVVLLRDRVLLAIVWIIAGVAAAEVARRRESITMAVQSVLWIVASALTGGLAMVLLNAMLGSNAIDLEVPPVVIVVSALALVARAFLARHRAARLVLLLIATCGLAAGALGLLASLTSGERATIALLRTVVLVVTIALLVLAARFTEAPEATTLARALLLLGGMKLLVEDLRLGRASTLVIALVLYGGAMLLVSRSPAFSRPERNG
jgi:hypothetical protein